MRQRLFALVPDTRVFPSWRLTVAASVCGITLCACGKREDVVGCLVHDGSVQYCLEQGPPLPGDARLHALDECKSVGGVLVDQCPAERRLGRCDWASAPASSARPVVAARRTYYYADAGGLKMFTPEMAQAACRAGRWVPEASEGEAREESP